MSCTRKPEPITIAEFSYEANALIYVALDRGFFGRNGLNVTLREDYASSIAVTNALLNNEADLAVGADFNIVGSAFERANIKVVGGIDNFFQSKNA